MGQSGIPLYENQDTLLRLETDLDSTNAKKIICLGDSFDDNEASQSLPSDELLWITKMQAGREWIWISGNHDPSPKNLGGSFLNALEIEKLNFQHIANAEDRFEISGHYHPKIRIIIKGQSFTKRCFLVDENRVILPAYGTYTGGLYCNRDPLRSIMQQKAIALMTGKEIYPIPISKAN
jgi:Predicted ICC-like phosphoesterases